MYLSSLWTEEIEVQQVHFYLRAKCEACPVLRAVRQSFDCARTDGQGKTLSHRPFLSLFFLHFSFPSTFHLSQAMLSIHSTMTNYELATLEDQLSSPRQIALSRIDYAKSGEADGGLPAIFLHPSTRRSRIRFRCNN